MLAGSVLGLSTPSPGTTTTLGLYPRSALLHVSLDLCNNMYTHTIGQAEINQDGG